MSPEQVDAYRTAGDNLPLIVGWFVNLVARYGIWNVIAVGTLGLLFAWLIAGILIDRHERRAERRSETPHNVRQLERYANDSSNHRKEEL